MIIDRVEPFHEKVAFVDRHAAACLRLSGAGAPKRKKAMKRVWIGGALLLVLLGIVAVVAIPKLLYLRAETRLRPAIDEAPRLSSLRSRGRISETPVPKAKSASATWNCSGRIGDLDHRTLYREVSRVDALLLV
jgi:hypothetical protein